MITVEGYKAFRGLMQITPKSAVFPPFTVAGDWLYKPDSDCWYCNGRSFAADICKVVVDLTEGGE